jgi:hypothetical protein
MAGIIEEFIVGSSDRAFEDTIVSVRDNNDAVSWTLITDQLTAEVQEWYQFANSVKPLDILTTF